MGTRAIRAILLAAGASQRFGTRNKLLAQIGGTPLIRKIAQEIVLNANLQTIVVTGCDQGSIEQALDGLPVDFSYNAQWAAGMGSSIATGIEALGRDIDGALIVPGDMPRLTAAAIGALIAAFDASDRAAIIVPVNAAGEQRNPVLWPKRFFPELRLLKGPTGGKGLLMCLAEDAVTVDFDDDAIFTDIDTQADLPRLAGAPQ